MININYNRLFNLRLAHTYYKNERGGGLKLKPTRDTLRILRGGKMLFKTIPFGVTILYRAVEGEVTPLVTLPDDLTLTFSLEAENKAEFLNITDLDETPARTYSASDILYFTNDPAPASASTDPEHPEEISHQLLDGIKNSLFTYEFSLGSAPEEVLIRVRNAAGTPVSFGKKVDGDPLPTTLTLSKKDDGSYDRQIDLRNKPTGRYTVTIRNTADDTTLREERFYVHDKLASRDILGIVDITYDSGTELLYDDTEEYELRFSRKETIWKYFIVNKNKKVRFSTENLSINDLGSPDYSSINFTREGPEPHPAVQINGLETVIFKSDDPIPFYEIPKTSIQLEKDPGDIVLIDNLPNPSHRGVVKKQGGILESEIYVFI
ncbi:hypothetical protein SAMN05443144_10669 [Fodinibius roseus]|uniref:Uncharacterized protein n=1 Tax=Fodinibius roseus TaxID=1194090 RepID=A0A1M4ZLT3_9BACT|nr:hypothetical protein [Fodinibius roseus]SHF18915.1 hypothetical protein SAMN05443144_10669 [Fodinibius roseus]